MKTLHCRPNEAGKGVKMLSDDDLKAVCSVTEMAKRLGMSRARFYQLQKMGIFPTPVYCIRTRRPFYPLDLQNKCVGVRKTGIGCNGQPILFNSPRKTVSDKSQSRSDQRCERLTSILRGMGLNVSCGKVKSAVEALYPEGLAKRCVEDTVIRDLFRHFA